MSRITSALSLPPMSSDHNLEAATAVTSLIGHLVRSTVVESKEESMDALSPLTGTDAVEFGTLRTYVDPNAPVSASAFARRFDL